MSKIALASAAEMDVPATLPRQKPARLWACLFAHADARADSNHRDIHLKFLVPLQEHS
jgi:hypothetical protein